MSDTSASSGTTSQDTKVPKPKKGSLETVICGGTAGLVSRFFIAPLDVLKIRLQLQSSERLYTGILQGFQTIIKREGMRGLWKGNLSAEILYVTYAASQFWTYQHLTDLLRGSLSSSTAPPSSSLSTTRSASARRAHEEEGEEGAMLRWSSHLPEYTHAFIAGAGAGAVATTATYPFDLLRTRFAAQGGVNHTTHYSGIEKKSRWGGGKTTGIVVALRHVWAAEGPRGLYRGLNASIVQIVPYMGLLFGTYEPCRHYLQKMDLLEPGRGLEGWESAVAGFLAGSISKVGVFPLDVVRKRLQVQGPHRTTAYVLSAIPVYASSFGCATQILRREGIRGLYKGLSVSLLKTAPSSAITLWTFEQSSKVFRFVEDNLAGVAAE